MRQKKESPAGQQGQSARQDKYTHFRTQKQRIYAFFLTHTTTMWEAEIKTGICRPSICRIVRKLEDAGHIHRVKQGLCPISKYRAWFFSATAPNARKGGAE